MQIRRAFFLSFFVAVACVQASSVNLTELLQQIPACAFGCIGKGVASLPQGLTDPRIVCRNETLEANAASCVLIRCQYEDQMQVAAVKAKFCEDVPIENRAWDVAVVGLICGPIALIAVALRCYSRYSTFRRLGSDDWLAVAAGLALVPFIVIDGMINGYGGYFWELDPSKIEALLKMFYISEILYIAALTLVKASMLVFYLRVFTTRWFIFIGLMTLCVVVLAGLGIMFALILQCIPISAVWHRTLNAQCININILSYLSAGISVALDVIILILPIPILIRLKMNLKKKLSLVLMFSLGSLACITSGIRLRYLVAFATRKDPTYLPLVGNNTLPAIWSFVEVCVALICACLPALRALLSRWFPSVFDLTSPTSPNLKEVPPPSRAPDAAVALYIPPFPHSREKFSTSFIEKFGPSYNKRAISRAHSYAPTQFTQATTRSSDIFPGGLSYHFAGQYQGLYGENGGRKNPYIHTPQRMSIPQSLSAKIESYSRAKSEIKIWINPRFDSQGDSVKIQNAPPRGSEQAELHYSLPTSERSLWALEGPRVNDDLNRREEERRELEERRVSRALCWAEEGVIGRPVGLALPMKEPRNGRLKKDGFQRL